MKKKNSSNFCKNLSDPLALGPGWKPHNHQLSRGLELNMIGLRLAHRDISGKVLASTLHPDRFGHWIVIERLTMSACLTGRMSVAY